MNPTFPARSVLGVARVTGAACLFSLAAACGSPPSSSADDPSELAADAVEYRSTEEALAEAEQWDFSNRTDAFAEESTAVGDTVAARPYKLKVPRGWDGQRALPLVVLLHSYGTPPEILDGALGLSSLGDEREFLFAMPRGRKDAIGALFWNATDACCNFGGKSVDDVAYLTSLVKDVQSRYPVDARRIFLVGHSNGAFMANRLACDVDWVAGIVSVAGVNWKDTSRCVGGSAPAILQVHGTRDGTIKYAGGTLFGTPYPGARESAAGWAQRYQCAAAAQSAGEPLDLDFQQAGAETQRERFDGCQGGAAVELWTMQNVQHVPFPNAQAAAALYDFLWSHPKR